jgi:SAM-dependent methyltransferase
MVHEYPKNFARFYDLIYHQIRDSVDHNYFLNEINQSPGKILEIGVGTGRFFTEAIDHGSDIYGIDISESMINVLKNKLDVRQHGRISVQNIIDFNFGFQFDLIIAPFRVIMHLLEKDDQIKALNNVYKHLNRGGRFIFDTFVPDLHQLITGLNDHTDFEGEFEPGLKVKRIVSTKPELINQLIRITFKLEWDENGRKEIEIWDSPLRFFFRYELEHLIERSDFENYKIYGDYQLNELTNTSKEFIVVCYKNQKSK